MVSLGVVSWEDGRTREVTHVCERCQLSHSQGNHTRRITDLRDVWLVSPSGVGHVQHEEYIERTLCGLDATGAEWWWRL